MKKQILITHAKATGQIGNDCGCPETEPPMLPDLVNNANTGELTREQALELQRYSEENDFLLDTQQQWAVNRALNKVDYSGAGSQGTTPDLSDEEEPMLPLT